MQFARTLWSRRWNNTTSILTIPANLSQELGAQTIMAGIVPIGQGGSGTSAYIFTHATGTATDGVRLLLTHNTGNPVLSFGADSSGAASAPNRVATNTAANYIPYGSYSDVCATWTGGLAASTIRMFRGVKGEIISEVTAYTDAAGVTAIEGPAGQDLTIGNRGDVGRAFNGDIFYVCRWNRVIGLTEMRMVQQQGPLRIKEGLVMCWARDRDWGPIGLNPSVITALSSGSSSAFVPRMYIGRRRDFVFDPGAAAFQAAWARNANTVLSTGARTPV